MKEVKHINLEEFNNLVIERKAKVLVDFYGTWCNPCKMLAPILEDVSKEVDIQICKVDVDENFELSKSYGVMSVTTLILFNDGKEQKRAIGLKNKDFVLDMIKD